MKTSRLTAIAAALLTTIAASLPARAQGETYPQRTVTIVVPFPAGSATDIVARKIAEGFRVAFGQAFIVENKAGADGIVAARTVLAASPDGHTLFMTTNTTQSANPNIYNQLPYDPQKDFVPIGGILKISYLMAVRANLAADDLASFVKLAKSAKPTLSFGSGNTGSRAAAELLKARLGFDMQHVPYRGSPQALNDLVGGQIDVFFPDPASALGLLGENKFKIIGSTGTNRIKTLPNVPTLTELGVSDYNIVAWVGLFAPAGLPKPIATKLNEALKAILDQPETLKFLGTLGAEPFPASSEELAAFVIEDTKRWKEIVDVAKIEKK
jgi:tripartite-type tricarboxylate transporter receptor subunit TctC